MSPEVSVMQILHFLQLHASGKFQQFDHGEQNVLHYKSPNPPQYNLDNVTAPMHLYSASNDILIPPKDVEHLKNSLPNVRSYEMFPDWNHIDVMLGKNAKEKLFEKILNSMNKNK